MAKHLKNRNKKVTKSQRKISKPKLKLAKQKMQSIEPYVSFNIKTPKTQKQINKINRYYKEITELQARPNYIYKTKSKKKLTAVQKYAQHENIEKFKEITVAFVPFDGKSKPKITFKGGKVTIRNKFVTSQLIEFDVKTLVKLKGKRLKKYLDDQILENKKHKRFKIHAGKYEITLAYSRNNITDNVIQLMNTYDTGNHHYKNWLHGVTAFEFSEQASFTEYNRAKNKARKEILAQRKKVRYTKANRKRKGG